MLLSKFSYLFLPNGVLLLRPEPIGVVFPETCTHLYWFKEFPLSYYTQAEFTIRAEWGSEGMATLSPLREVS
jgi:hypothetical protein